MRIASGSAVFFASTLAAASATPQTPVAPSLPFRGDLLIKGRIAPSSRRVSYAHLFPLGSESPQCYQPRPVDQPLIAASASADFTEAVAEALSKTVSIVTKFKKSQKSPVKVNTPSAPPNTPILSCPGLGLGLSIMDPMLGEIPIDSSFCYNDNATVSQATSPKISSLPASNTPGLEDFSSLSNDLSEALENLANSDLDWSSNDMICPVSSPFLQPPNTPVNNPRQFLAPSLTCSEMDLEEMDIGDMDIPEMGDSQFPLISVHEDLAPISKLRSFYLQDQELDSSPSTYYHDRKRTTWVSLFPSTVLQKSISSSQLIYLDVCLRYLDSAL